VLQLLIFWGIHTVLAREYHKHVKVKQTCNIILFSSDKIGFSDIRNFINSADSQLLVSTDLTVIWRQQI